MPIVQITYDREADVLALLLTDADVEETKSIAPGVHVDYDFSGHVSAIEFLNASKKYDLSRTELEEPDPYFTLAEAGYLFDLSPTTLRHQIHRGALRGTKIGRNWVVHRDDLNDYIAERSRKVRGTGRVSDGAGRVRQTRSLFGKNAGSDDGQTAESAESTIRRRRKGETVGLEIRRP